MMVYFVFFIGFQESMKPIIMTIHPWHLHVKNTKLTYRKTKSRRPCIFVIGIMGFYLLEISSSFGKVLEILCIFAGNFQMSEVFFESIFYEYITNIFDILSSDISIS